MNTFYAMNRQNKTAVLLNGFSCWEHVQAAFRCGLLMPDNKPADAIGRCHSEKQFHSRATFGEWSVLKYDGFKVREYCDAMEKI